MTKVTTKAVTVATAVLDCGRFRTTIVPDSNTPYMPPMDYVSKSRPPRHLRWYRFRRFLGTFRDLLFSIRCKDPTCQGFHMPQRPDFFGRSIGGGDGIGRNPLLVPRRSRRYWVSWKTLGRHCHLGNDRGSTSRPPRVPPIRNCRRTNWDAARTVS